MDRVRGGSQRPRRRRVLHVDYLGTGLRVASNGTASGRGASQASWSKNGFDPRLGERSAVPVNVHSWQILLQKSFCGGERKFLELLMRFARGDVRDHIV